MNASFIGGYLRNFAVFPLFAYSSHCSPPSISFLSAEFAKSFSSVFFSMNNGMNVRASTSLFRYFLNSPFHIESLTRTSINGTSSYCPTTVASFSFCRFIHCSTTSYGGAIYFSVSSSNFSLKSNLFYDCNATTNAGAVYSSAYSISSNYLCFVLCSSFRTSSSTYSWANAAKFLASQDSFCNSSAFVRCSDQSISSLWDGCFTFMDDSADIASDLNFSKCYSPVSSGFVYQSGIGSVTQFICNNNMSGENCLFFYSSYLSGATFQYINILGGSFSVADFDIGYSLSSVVVNNVVLKGVSGTATGSSNSYSITINNCYSDSSDTFFPVEAVNTWLCLGSVIAPEYMSAFMTQSAVRMNGFFLLGFSLIIAAL